VARKLLLLFSLYFCQGLPGGFLAVALPVILREQGADLKTIGLTAALSLPWVLKVFWSPLVDAYGSQRFGRRRSWLVPAQLGMLLVTLSFTTFDPIANLWTVALLFLVLNTFAATQDIAVDGWAVDMLEEDELGPGNSAQVAGFKIGNLVGGGVLLALSGVLGWTGNFGVMALLIAAVLILVTLTPERIPSARLVRAPPAGSAGIRPALGALWRSMRAQGPWLWIFLLYAKFGESFGGSMVKPMLVDQDFSRELIGIVDGIYGSLATIVGAIGAGLVLRRRSWGASLGVFAILQGAALIGIGIAQTGPLSLGTFVALNVVENLGGGGVGVCIFALAMRHSDAFVGASNFTAAQVIYMLGAFLAGPLSGALADEAGYLPSMIAGGLMAASLAVLAPRVARMFPRPASMAG
jgi:MFS transporter, PAT family, beta-lactamase induction signal transducer AmpG